jgi:hypothetical protein
LQGELIKEIKERRVMAGGAERLDPRKIRVPSGWWSENGVLLRISGVNIGKKTAFLILLPAIKIFFWVGGKK